MMPTGTLLFLISVSLVIIPTFVKGFSNEQLNDRHHHRNLTQYLGKYHASGLVYRVEILSNIKNTCVLQPYKNFKIASARTVNILKIGPKINEESWMVSIGNNDLSDIMSSDDKRPVKLYIGNGNKMMLFRENEFYLSIARNDVESQQVSTKYLSRFKESSFWKLYQLGPQNCSF